jgi:hypothetical protein
MVRCRACGEQITIPRLLCFSKGGSSRLRGSSANESFNPSQRELSENEKQKSKITGEEMK